MYMYYYLYRSPNHYAHQRTMVVMETVRAATLATARRLERLAAEAEKQKQSPEHKAPSAAKPSECLWAHCLVVCLLLLFHVYTTVIIPVSYTHLTLPTIYSV